MRFQLSDVIVLALFAIGLVVVEARGSGAVTSCTVCKMDDLVQGCIAPVAVARSNPRTRGADTTADPNADAHPQ